MSKKSAPPSRKPYNPNLPNHYAPDSLGNPYTCKEEHNHPPSWKRQYFGLDWHAIKRFWFPLIIGIPPVFLLSYLVNGLAHWRVLLILLTAYLIADWIVWLYRYLYESWNEYRHVQKTADTMAKRRERNENPNAAEERFGDEDPYVNQVPF